MFEQSVHGSAGSTALIGFMINGSLIMIDVMTFEDELSGFVYKKSIRTEKVKQRKIEPLRNMYRKPAMGP